MLGGVATAVAVVERGRARVAAYALLPAPTNDSALVEGVQTQVTGLVVAGALTIAVLGWLLWIARRPRTSSRELGWAGLFLPALPAAVGVLAYGWAVSRGYRGVAGMDVGLKLEYLRQSLEASGVYLKMARVATWLAVGLAAVAGFVWARHGRAVSRKRMAAAAALCGVGALAFAATRQQAADGVPLPILENGVVEFPSFEQVPRLANCSRQMESLPVLRFGPDAVTVDGSVVEPDGFRDHLMVTRANHQLIHQGRPAPATLAVVVARAGTPLARIIPYLQKGASGAWMMASIAAHPYQSKTLGVVPRYQHCGRIFQLSESATPISHYSTWADLAKAIDHSPAALELAPW